MQQSISSPDERKKSERSQRKAKGKLGAGLYSLKYMTFQPLTDKGFGPAIQLNANLEPQAQR